MTIEVTACSARHPQKGGFGKLVLVRHGLSDYNQDNRFTGWTDVALSEAGRDEAREAGHLLSDLCFDFAFTSALERAQTTLTLLLLAAGQNNVPSEASAALNERDYGQLNGLNKSEAAERFGTKQVEEWRRSYHACPPGGESLEMTSQRVVPYYETRILPLLKSGHTVLVSSHGNTIRALVMHVLDIPVDMIHETEIGWCEPIVMHVDAEGTVGHVTCLKRTNSVSHTHLPVSPPPRLPSPTYVPPPNPDVPHYAKVKCT